MSDQEENSNIPELSEERRAELNKFLENRLGKFDKVFRMLDTDNPEERINAFKSLNGTIKDINKTYEELTGKENFITYSYLLEQISSSSDSGIDEEQVEQLLQANEDLKEAEGLLVEEVERLRTIVKIQQYSNLDMDDSLEFFENLNSHRQLIEDFLKKTSLVANNSQIITDSLYSDALNTEYSKFLGSDSNKGKKLKERVIDKVLKVIGYDTNTERYEQSKENKALLKAQNSVINEHSSRFSSQITEIEEAVIGFSKYLEASKYRIDDKDGTLLKQLFKQLEESRIELDKSMAAECENAVSSKRAEELQGQLSSLEEHSKKLVKIVENIGSVDNLASYYSGVMRLTKEEAFERACENASKVSSKDSGHYKELVDELETAIRNSTFEISKNLKIELRAEYEKEYSRAISDSNKLIDRLFKERDSADMQKDEAKEKCGILAQANNRVKNISATLCWALLGGSLIFAYDEYKDNAQEERLKDVIKILQTGGDYASQEEAKHRKKFEF